MDSVVCLETAPQANNSNHFLSPERSACKAVVIYGNIVYVVNSYCLFFAFSNDLHSALVSIDGILRNTLESTTVVLFSKATENCNVIQ